MQIDLLETFLDLAETRSFRRSAERLGVTQSTVSARIKALEDGLGRRLFRRSRAGTELTAEGHRFEPHARSIRHDWGEAVNAARGAGPGSASLRIGYQHDLSSAAAGGAGAGAGRWIADIRELMPDATIYIEADYSIQMVAELVTGGLDLGLLFTPRPHPDLHFETLGEIAYTMVSTETGTLGGVRPESYILANYSPAFATAHAGLHPQLSAARLSTGQSSVVTDLLDALGGSAYLRRETAGQLAADGRVRLVRDAPEIAQSVYAAVHLRNRHRGLHRSLIRLLRRSFA